MVLPIVTPPPVVPLEEEVFWREVKKDVIPVTARLVTQYPPPRTRLHGGPFKERFSRVIHSLPRKFYGGGLHRRAELLPVMNSQSPILDPPTLFANSQAQKPKKRGQELVHEVAAILGYILLGLFLGVAIISIIFACCAPLCRYMWYGKKAIHVYRSYKTHKQERKKAKEIKRHGDILAHAGEWIYFLQTQADKRLQDVAHPAPAHFSRGTAPTPEESNGRRIWSFMQSNIVYDHNPMMNTASWHTARSVDGYRHDSDPHLTPSSVSTRTCPAPVPFCKRIIFGHRGRGSIDSPPPLPPRPIPRITTPSSAYEYPSGLIFGDGVGETITRLWSQES